MSFAPRANEPPGKETPKTLGSGFVTATLGEGGAAVVYEIWNPKLEIHRAVKLWRPNVSEKDLQRFETEIKITSKLDHPNIVEIHTVGEWNGLPYIEMERIDGFSLQQLLKTNGPLPPAVAIAITILICRALLYAHQEEFNLYGRKRKGVIHCDIKPANIMITRIGLVKLMDFGIANPTNVTLHTDPDKVTGSLQYMAPEQIRSRQVDARTDIYAVGVVLYEILSGTKVFPSKQLLEVIEKRKTNEHVPLGQLITTLPKHLYTLVATCMEMMPENRYQNVAELLKALNTQYRKFSLDDPQTVIQRFLEKGTIPLQKLRLTRHTTTTIIAAVVPTLILVVVIIGSILGPGNRQSPPQQQTTINIPAAQQQPVPPVVPLSIPQPPTQPFSEDSQVATPTATMSLPQTHVHSVARPVTPKVADPISQLEAMVDGGNLDGALKKIEAQTINDGAFYALYARCLYEKGAWKKAYEMAEKSTRIPSNRISESSRTGQFLLYKAKNLSVQFDANPSGATAQTAITAWWQVRDHFEGTSEGAKAAFADSEIGRLSKILNN